jgi:3',5'-cyclic AMP phosphodiesterase CpdA
MRPRRLVLLGLVGLGLCASPPAAAAPFTTVQRTIQDCDSDNLLEYAFGEEHLFFGDPLPSSDPCSREFGEGQLLRLPPRASIVNFLQLSDFQMVDEEAPARVEWLDATQRIPRLQPFSAAYRPQESLTTQTTEAMVRQARNAVSPVTAKRLDLAILTGDNADSQQYNETRWFIDILDGTTNSSPPHPDPEMEDPTLVQPDGSVSPPTGPRDRKIDPNSGIPGPDPNAVASPAPACDATPGSVYDGVRDTGDRETFPDFGYYEPDSSTGEREDGDGYTPSREDNLRETPGRDVTVRDFPGLFEAANEPFEALGLDMPWYSAFGNHDALVQGNSPEAFLGPFGPGHALAPEASEEYNEAFHRVATGCVKVMQPAAGPRGVIEGLIEEIGELRRDGVTPAEQETIDQLTGQVLGAANDVILNPCDPDEDEGCVVEIVPPDPRRCFLPKDELNTTAPGSPCQTGSWIRQHFRTTGTPVGHGFAPSPGLPLAKQGPFCEQHPRDDDCVQATYGRPLEAERNNDGYYSFSPKPGLRFVTLDTITDECGSEFCSEGSVDDPQFEWLREQIATAETLGQYVVVFSHHTLRTIRFVSTDPTEQPIHYGQRFDRRSPGNPQNQGGGDTLEELYCGHPAVLAHVAGHEHENYVERHDCADDEPPPPLCAVKACPNPHFWQISTAAHIDWPQQARMIELVKLGPNMSFVLTMLDHDGPANPGGAPPGKEEQGHAPDDVVRLSAIAREIAYNDYQADRGARGGRHDRNVILATDRPPPPADAP